MLNEYDYQQRTARALRDGERAAFARLDADMERHDRFMDALERCETLDDLYSAFGDHVTRKVRHDSPLFSAYCIDGYGVLICDDCGAIVDEDDINHNENDQCPHCGYCVEND